MTTPLGFMVARVEDRIFYSDVCDSDTFGDIKRRLLTDLQAKGVAVSTWNQIRLIFAGRIIKDSESVQSIKNEMVEPPYTLQVMIRGENASDEDPLTERNTSFWSWLPKCVLL